MYAVKSGEVPTATPINALSCSLLLCYCKMYFRINFEIMCYNGLAIAFHLTDFVTKFNVKCNVVMQL